jgi:hypothetical protein
MVRFALLYTPYKLRNIYAIEVGCVEQSETHQLWLLGLTLLLLFHTQAYVLV